MIQIVKANGRAEQELFDRLKSRSREVDKQVTASVSDIIEAVRLRKDEAVREYSLRFDGYAPQIMEISPLRVQESLSTCAPDFVRALRNAARNITRFHQQQKAEGWSLTDEQGCILGQRVRGLQRVGIYVPGGTAPYPSTVLMDTIPARIAGVEEIIMVTPPGKNGQPSGAVLAAAAIAGVDRVFMVGGAQAVAALAFGTETIPQVDKIVGPGNIYVATAKRLLYGTVDIDMVAGPSEILILADETANPVYVAADLMSQAEHDVLASAILLTTSEALCDAVNKEIKKQVKNLSRSDIIKQSLKDFSAAVLCPDISTAVEIANQLAPEHLEVITADPMSLLNRLHNVGSVFLGEYSPEPLGDYYAGPNHVLPTSGTARFFSPLSVDSFVKKSSYIYYTKEALEQAAEDIVCLAEQEELTAHANSIKVRVSHGLHTE